MDAAGAALPPPARAMATAATRATGASAHVERILASKLTCHGTHLPIDFPAGTMPARCRALKHAQIAEVASNPTGSPAREGGPEWATPEGENDHPESCGGST